MKIEKLSDNQIRCTLKKSDLTSRHLKISELAYGSDKAKELFRDIIKQASYEFGFEADDIPLMIEAIPISADCIVLIVTKVEDPDELDTRFSKFSPDDFDSDDDYGYPFDDDFESLSTIDEPADYPDSTAHVPTASDELDIPSDDVTNDVLNLFSKVKDYLNKNINSITGADDDTDSSINDISGDDTNSDTKSANDNFVPLKDSYNNSKKVSAQQKDSGLKMLAEPIIRIFIFNGFNTFSNAAVAVNNLYNDKNSLYREPTSSVYYLVLEKQTCSPTDFNKTCNILSEYAVKESANRNRVSFFNEHYECIVRDNAIQVISSIN